MRQKRIAVLAGVVFALLVCGGAAAFAVARGQASPVSYGSAREMAARAGCLASFVEDPAPGGVTSAGHCEVTRVRVEFRVESRAKVNMDSADPWPDPSRRRMFTVVSSGWLYRTSDLAVFRRISEPLQNS
jgi:hypothetical protein